MIWTIVAGLGKHIVARLIDQIADDLLDHIPVHPEWSMQE